MTLLKTLIVTVALLFGGGFQSGPREGTYEFDSGLSVRDTVYLSITLKRTAKGDFEVTGKQVLTDPPSENRILGTLRSATGKLSARVISKKDGKTRELPLDGRWSEKDGGLVLNRGFALPNNVLVVQAVDYTGEWSTSEASHMVLRQSGNHVEGEYNYAGGKITGTVKGNVLDFKWVQTNDRAGVGKFYMTSDGNNFGGKWDYTQPPEAAGKGKGWTGTRIKKKE